MKDMVGESKVPFLIAKASIKFDEGGPSTLVALGKLPILQGNLMELTSVND
jgi:hypothetical protein